MNTYDSVAAWQLTTGDIIFSNDETIELTSVTDSGNVVLVNGVGLETDFDYVDLELLSDDVFDLYS